MNQENRKFSPERDVVVIAFQNSIFLNAIVRNLEEQHFTVHLVDDVIQGLDPYMGKQLLFILHLDNHLLDQRIALFNLSTALESIQKVRQDLFVIEDKNYHHEFMEALPGLEGYPLFAKPLDMEQFILTVKKETVRLATSKETRILIVDDDPAFAKMMRSNLADYYKVSVVTSGAHAFVFLAKNAVDLVLLDYEMPVLSGLKVLKRLRQTPGLEELPVIFLTGIDNKEIVTQVLNLKPDGYILKSSSKEELLLKIEDVFRKRA